MTHLGETPLLTYFVYLHAFDATGGVKTHTIRFLHTIKFFSSWMIVLYGKYIINIPLTRMSEERVKDVLLMGIIFADIL